jgi:CPA1 family monovalent cation:H+ antiporter
MEGLEVTVLLGLSVLAGTILAPRLRVATPLVLLVIGLVLGFVAALRHIELPPETVLLLFLPVMLFWESLTTSLRGVRRSLRYIIPMSTLLVVASAFASRGWPRSGLPWPAAMILGAAVAPPMPRLSPRSDGCFQRTFMKLKAESLTNDGTAFVLPRHRDLRRTRRHRHGLVDHRHRARLLPRRSDRRDRRRGARLPRAAAHAQCPVDQRDAAAGSVHGVPARRTGQRLGRSRRRVRGPDHRLGLAARITTAASRRTAMAAWPFGVYLLNGALFVLIGLEVQLVLHEISRDVWGLVLLTVAAWAALLVVRYVFQVADGPVLAPTYPALTAFRPGSLNRARIVSTMAGFRGAVSLAIALSVPLTTSSGHPSSAATPSSS